MMQCADKVVLREKSAPLEHAEVVDWTDAKERFEDTSDESDSDSDERVIRMMSHPQKIRNRRIRMPAMRKLGRDATASMLKRKLVKLR